jgi:hypothetical protein
MKHKNKIQCKYDTPNYIIHAQLPTVPHNVQLPLGFRFVYKSTANPQLYDKSYNLLHNKSTANPQQIEQVEFELKSIANSRETHSHCLQKYEGPATLGSTKFCSSSRRPEDQTGLNTHLNAALMLMIYSLSDIKQPN